MNMDGLLPLSIPKRVHRERGSAAFNATEEIANVRLIISFFKSKLLLATKTRYANGGEDSEIEEIEDVMSVILENLGSLELLTARTSDIEEPFKEKDHVDFFQALVEVVYIDTIDLLDS
jgi:hypothetical protein